MAGVQVPLTIGVPVYNGGALFADMLDSMLAQTYRDFRILVLDNASTDETGELARAYAARDTRVTYVRNDQNIGAAPNFNRVFELAEPGPLFKWAAHDDIYAPTYVERCVEALATRPGTVLAYSIVDVIDESGTDQLFQHASYGRGVIKRFVDDQGRPGLVMGPWGLAEGPSPVDRYRELLNQMIACFPLFGVIRTEALKRSGLIRGYYGSDRALLAELVLQGPFHQVRERLYTNRFHRRASRLLSRSDQQRWIGAVAGASHPKLRQSLDLLRAPMRAGLGPVETAGCLGVALRHLGRRHAGRMARRAGWPNGSVHAGDGSAR